MANSKWTVDTDHSSLDFSVKHMVIAKVKGSFKQFEAQVEADPEDLTTADIEFKVDLNSIDTRNADRDIHLRSEDFFHAAEHPQMIFKSTNISNTGGNTYDITGDLAIRGVTRPITFAAVYEGSVKDPWGNERVGFSAHGTLNRQDYGLKWNMVLETGGVLVGDKVQIDIELEATKQA